MSPETPSSAASSRPTPAERKARREAAIRAAKREFESYTDSEKADLIAQQERADEAGRFIANYRWTGP